VTCQVQDSQKRKKYFILEKAWEGAQLGGAKTSNLITPQTGNSDNADVKKKSNVVIEV